MNPSPRHITNNVNITLLLALCAAAALAGCGKEGTTTVVVAPPPQAAAPAVAAASTPVPPAPPASAAPAAATAAAPALAASTDLDNPTPLPSRELKGTGVKQKLSYYYSFSAPAGPIKITTVSKNSPSGATQALGFALYDRKANRLCFDSSGNTNSDKTVVLNCQIEKAQPLILRLDLAEETIDYSVLLDGTIELPAPQAATTTSVAGPGSTDIDEPTRLKTNRVKGDGTKKAVAYYYAFNAGPGELTLTIDGKNTSAATTEALLGGLYTLRSERICQIELGNTTLEKRGVVACKVDKRQPVILRLDLSAETVDFRARFDGPYDFEEFVAPKAIAIALDAAVLFDSGASVLKPEARKTLDEAAARVKKFTDAPVAISGHTDSVGNDAANQMLSENRASAVRDYFVNLAAVPAGRLSIKGYGKTQPVADNKTEEGRARNRRVDVVITPK